MTKAETEEYLVGGKVQGGKFNEIFLIIKTERDTEIYGKQPFWKDRYGNVFLRQPNSFMKAIQVYYAKANDISDFIEELKQEGFVILSFPSESTFTRDILSTSDFPIPA